MTEMTEAEVRKHATEALDRIDNMIHYLAGTRKLSRVHLTPKQLTACKKVLGCDTYKGIQLVST